jgi:hypothetical protein
MISSNINNDKHHNNHQDLTYGHSSEVNHGYEESIDKYYIEIIDNETRENMKVYLDKEDFQMFACSMINSITRLEKEKEKLQ